ncbi:DUF998 domain-containing protein [Occultella aeris]|uniref:DUF998 domain-containing protein n=1 Tax=Occultella aeris TaxID=2761496 RepID=A0A7M4DPW9_9MICO|nr:DUF998 domain-containing protein [Occultella aeris]VZO39513.1 hypothetical protein HALOF300_04205 [Occultella aeris]
MSTNTAAPARSGRDGRPRAAVHVSTHALTTTAALAGPFFFASSALQALARDGFDIRVHPLSQLATGDLGWIQLATFVLTGLAAGGLAVAHRRLVTTGAGSRIIPVFLAVFAGAFVAAGLFPMDPQNAFPIGAPDGPVTMSWHSIVHSTAAAVSFTALAGACIAALVRSIRHRRSLASIGHGLVALTLLLPADPTWWTVQLVITSMIAFTWVSLTALRLRKGV